MGYINIHTHKPAYLGTEIINISKLDIITNDTYYSIGIHPWDISKTLNIEEELLKINKTASQHHNCISIGECGLDRVCNTDWELQNEIFLKQIQIAKLYGLPIIVHCVKSYSDILFYVKQYSPYVIFILHDFNGNNDTYDKLSIFNCYFSFSPRILNPNSKAHKIAQIVPLEKIFLETDNTDFSISELYKYTSNLRQKSEKELILIIESNFKKIFTGEK